MGPTFIYHSAYILCCGLQPCCSCWWDFCPTPALQSTCTLLLMADSWHLIYSQQGRGIFPGAPPPLVVANLQYKPHSCRWIGLCHSVETPCTLPRGLRWACKGSPSPVSNDLDARAGDLHHEVLHNGLMQILENQYHNFSKVQVHFYCIILTVFLLITKPRIGGASNNVLACARRIIIFLQLRSFIPYRRFFRHI